MSLLEARGITKRFAGITALDDVDLTVEPAEMLGLIGPNGAGKTTLFGCIYGILRPNAGTVVFEGHDITRLPVYRRSRLGFGRTFQRMELFGGMTVLDHLLVAERARVRRSGLGRDLTFRGWPSDLERDRAAHTLDLLGLGGDAERPIEALSLGRARLVEFGRALMTEPKVLFLDEPFSGLDHDETAEVAQSLVEIQRERGTAVVLVEHDIATVKALASRLYVLDYGKVIATGPTEEVMNDPRVTEAYLGVAG
jgi:branched-chain amino acid transport system ATP-binding protein